MHAIQNAVVNGRQKLVQQFPHLLEASELATEENANLVGMTLEELEEVTLLRSLDAFAREAGHDLIDILIRYGADSDDDAAALLARRRALAGGPGIQPTDLQYQTKATGSY